MDYRILGKSDLDSLNEGASVYVKFDENKYKPYVLTKKLEDSPGKLYAIMLTKDNTEEIIPIKTDTENQVRAYLPQLRWSYLYIPQSGGRRKHRQATKKARKHGRGTKKARKYRNRSSRRK